MIRLSHKFERENKMTNSEKAQIILESIVTEDVVKRVAQEMSKLEDTNSEFMSMTHCGSDDVLNEGPITAAFMISYLVKEITA